MTERERIIKHVLSFSNVLGFDPMMIDQNEYEWTLMKLGVLSSSRAKDIVASGKMRQSYMAELIGQILTGLIPEVSAKQLEWGHENEDKARAWYEFEYGELLNIPFYYKDVPVDDPLYMRVGFSPDSLLPENKKVVEVKSPYTTKEFVNIAAFDVRKPEWAWQFDMQLWVIGYDHLDFIYHDPRLVRSKANRVMLLPIEKNLKKQKTLDDAIPQFVSDMDKALAKLGVKFGDQWRKAA